MKSLAVLILAVFTCVVGAQKGAEAELLWEVEKPNCEMLSAFLDLLTVRLQENRNSRGLVVIKGDEANMRDNVIYESMVLRYFDDKTDVRPRISVLRAKSNSKMTLQSWIVPASAKTPEISIANWSYAAAAGTKPYLFTWENIYDGICPDAEDLRLFADFLKANPSARGNIVVRDPSQRRIAQKQAKIIKELTKTFGISRKQLRIFKSFEPSTGMLPPVEYWFVP